LNYASSITSAVERVDGNPNYPIDYTQVFYINPLNKTMPATSLEVVPYHPSYPNSLAQLDPSVTNFHIYEYTDGSLLNDSFSNDYSLAIDVTSQYSPIWNEDGTVTFNFGDITKTYVVVVDSVTKVDPSNKILVQSGLVSADTTQGTHVTRSTANLTQAFSGVSIGSPTFKLGNFVWNDLNKNGIQEIGENGVANVTVTITNSNGTVVGTTQTDVNGGYLFQNLPEGTYTVEFSNIPTGFVVSPSNSGTDPSLDSNGLISTVTIANGDNLTADLGIYEPIYRIGDYVWLDTDGDGIQGTSVDEAPFEGAQVILYDENGNKIAETLTDNRGYYEFNNLDNGTYQVEFINPNPDMLAFTKQNAGADNVDSDVSDANNRVTVTINNADNMTIDAGLQQVYSIGDKVWLDTNGDDIQNGGTEPGIAGVQVQLVDKTTGTVIQTQTTDVNGDYLFTGLKPGDYTVVFGTPAQVTNPDGTTTNYTEV
ncbi:SdrD B-like domain-containing protein, partial [Macrococcus sp. DPC7161]|uniref:SdrD B-like domain-containing protein n=1 Tax=Macrococcus sp. DPC7161 TaxID=2507060 RepID=UPI0010E553A4